MPDDVTSGGSISYRVKDILDQINSKLDRVMAQLDTKADREDVRDLRSRVVTLEIRGKLEDDRAAQSESAFTRRDKAFGLLIALVAIVFDPLLHSGVFR
jgi:two-component sensor histidine kinase